MFQTLTNVQSEEAVPLLVPIENHNSNLWVGLCTITYTVGWYNVEPGETFSWRASSNNESHWPTSPHSTTVAPGLYGIEDLINLLEGAANVRSERIAISTNRVNGYLHSQSRMDGRYRLQMGCSNSWVWTIDVGASGLTVEHTMVIAQSTSLPQCVPEPAQHNWQHDGWCPIRPSHQHRGGT